MEAKKKKKKKTAESERCKTLGQNGVLWMRDEHKARGMKKRKVCIERENKRKMKENRRKGGKIMRENYTKARGCGLH